MLTYQREYTVFYALFYITSKRIMTIEALAKAVNRATPIEFTCTTDSERYHLRIFANSELSFTFTPAKLPDASAQKMTFPQYSWNSSEEEMVWSLVDWRTPVYHMGNSQPPPLLALFTDTDELGGETIEAVLDAWLTETLQTERVVRNVCMLKSGTLYAYVSPFSNLVFECSREQALEILKHGIDAMSHKLKCLTIPSDVPFDLVDIWPQNRAIPNRVAHVVERCRALFGVPFDAQRPAAVVDGPYSTWQLPRSVLVQMGQTADKIASVFLPNFKSNTISSVFSELARGSHGLLRIFRCSQRPSLRLLFLPLCTQPLWIMQATVRNRWDASPLANAAELVAFLLNHSDVQCANATLNFENREPCLPLIDIEDDACAISEVLVLLGEIGVDSNVLASLIQVAQLRQLEMRVLEFISLDAYRNAAGQLSAVLPWQADPDISDAHSPLTFLDWKRKRSKQTYISKQQKQVLFCEQSDALLERCGLLAPVQSSWGWEYPHRDKAITDMYVIHGSSEQGELELGGPAVPSLIVTPSAKTRYVWSFVEAINANYSTGYLSSWAWRYVSQLNMSVADADAYARTMASMRTHVRELDRVLLKKEMANSPTFLSAVSLAQVAGLVAFLVPTLTVVEIPSVFRMSNLRTGRVYESTGPFAGQWTMHPVGKPPFDRILASDSWKVGDTDLVIKEDKAVAEISAAENGTFSVVPVGRFGPWHINHLCAAISQTPALEHRVVLFVHAGEKTPRGAVLYENGTSMTLQTVLVNSE